MTQETNPTRARARTIFGMRETRATCNQLFSPVLHLRIEITTKTIVMYVTQPKYPANSKYKGQVQETRCRLKYSTARKAQREVAKSGASV